MKKVAFMFVAAMAMSFAACTGNQKANTEGTDSLDATIDEVVETVVEDVDSTAQEVGDSLTEVAAEVVETVEAQ